MFKRMLFAVDFSVSTEYILPFALNLRDIFQARLHLVHVASDLKEMASVAIPHPAYKTFSTEIELAAQKMMKNLYDEHYYELQDVEQHILVGDPATDLVKFAEDNAIDLIVMGTHGRKGLDRVIFGSVAENVLRNSSVPVLTINPYRSKQDLSAIQGPS